MAIKTTSGGRMTKVRRVWSAEDWKAARDLFEGGLALEKIAEKTGIAYSTIRSHARFECWGSPRLRARGRPRLFSPERVKAIEEKLQHEETLMSLEPLVIKAESLEVLSRRFLQRDSARVKLLLSRRITEILIR